MNEKTKKESIHQCLNNCNKLHGCSTCPISLKNYCQIFQTFLNKSDNNLKRKCNIQSLQDRQDIISDTIGGIIISIGSKIEEGIDIKYPTALMRQVYNFKVSDFFRKQPNFSEHKEVIIEPADDINIDDLKKIEKKFFDVLSIDYESKKLKLLSRTIPDGIKESLQSLSNNTIWQKKLNNYFKYYNQAVIQTLVEDNNDEKRGKTIEDYPSPSDSNDAKEVVEKLIKEVEKLQTKTAATCATLFREYLRVLKEDGQLRDLAPVFGITANAVSQKLSRCRDLIFQKIKGVKAYVTR